MAKQQNHSGLGKPFTNHEFHSISECDFSAVRRGMIALGVMSSALD
jgi:hypothetical protein